MSLYYIGDTKIYGKGLFTKNDIKKGEIITILRGKVLTGIKYEYDFTEDAKKWIQIDKLNWLKSRAGSFLNHSCNPNASISGRKIVALRNIKKDEEITYDYDTRDWDEWGWQLKCKCGSKNCRKIIRGYKHLPQKLKNKYIKLDLIPDFLIRLDSGERLED